MFEKQSSDVGKRIASTSPRAKTFCLRAHVSHPRGSVTRIVTAEEEAVTGWTRDLLELEGSFVKFVSRNDTRVEQERLKTSSKQD